MTTDSQEQITSYFRAFAQELSARLKRPGGELPTQRQLAEFQARVAAARRLPDSLHSLFLSLPRSTPW